MSGFRISMPASPLEQRAYQQRLEALGISVRKDGTIDESSVARLRAGGKTGVEALASVVGPDGVLDAHGAAKLDANLKLLDRLAGKSASVSAVQSGAVLSAALAMDGLAKTLDVTADRARRGEPVPQEQLDRIGRSLEHVKKQWAPVVSAEAKLAQVDASAVNQIVESFTALNQAAAALGIELSKQRESVLTSASPSAKDVHTMLAGLSSTIHQLDLIRDASLFVAGRPGPGAAKSIDEVLSSLQSSLAPSQKASLESVVEKAARVKEMLEKVPSFASSEEVHTLASFVNERLSTKDQVADVGPALLLLAYDVPATFAPPNGRQQLVITALGLRVVGADPSSPTRVPTPSELSAAGLSWSRIEEATRSLLQRVEKLGPEAGSQLVHLNKEDRLYTNGNRASVDRMQLELDWAAAQKHADPKHRAGEMVRVINEYATAMSAGEVRDFARQVLRDMARQPIPSGTRVGHSHAQLEVMDAIISHLKRFPFHRSNLGDINDRARAVRDHLYSGFYDSDHHQQWLNRWHIDSSFKYD